MKQFAFGLGLSIGLVLIALVLLNWFDPGQADLRGVKTALATERERELAPLWLAVNRVLIVALGVLVAGLAAIALAAGLSALGNVPNVVRYGWVRSWVLKPSRVGGLYGTVVAPDGHGHIRVMPPVNEPGAARVAAATNGVVDRYGAGAMRQLMRPDDPQYMLPDTAGPQTVSLQEALDFDPVQSPHALFIGDTGSGKSTAIYSYLDAIRRRLPAEFLILEREGQNWNEQAGAITVPGYLEALERVEAERLERAKRLRAEDVDHASKLEDPPKYLVVVIEEAESVYTAMKLAGQARARRYTAIVRDLASMGRKQGVILVVATQTGTSEVFDVPTRKNLGHKFFFRNEPAVADQWGIDRKQVNLAHLEPGTAWSLNHSALVTFPRAARPVLPLSRLYRERRPEAVLQLPADAEADGTGAADMPDTGTGTGTVLVDHALGGGSGASTSTRIDTRTGTPVTFANVTTAADLDERQRQHIIATWEALCRKGGQPPALAAAQRAAIGYSGGQAYYIVEPVLREYHEQRGLPLPWRR